MKSPSAKSDANLQLIPMTVDVDLVRFEKNLLQIGFFGANDARDKNRTSRRIEQTVVRNGHKIRVAAEFRGSEKLGLPSTTDRDKFIALLKIINEERTRMGQITNPVRFSGYRMIQELGLSRNGEIYEEILRWGKRMTDTTITSEQVVYFAAKKVYSDEVLHVFRSFRRTGSSRLSGSERQEHYEVVLEDWILENLNQRYVIPEDFNAYKQLTRPTAKGIFGNLHLWFHASQGRQVEKDYVELCNLLNVQAYPHLSKIKSTMGLALNELVAIKYISRWDVQQMSSKAGYKIVLTPGATLLEILNQGQRERREVARDADPAAAMQLIPSQSLTGEGSNRDEAAEMLRRYGVLPTKAKQLLERHGAETVIDTVDYLETQMQPGKRAKVENPAGLIVYSIQNGLQVPDGFITRRKRLAIKALAQGERARMEARTEAELAYGEWLETQKTEALHTRFPEDELQIRLTELVAERVRTDEAFRRVPAGSRKGLAQRILMRELADGMVLPSFDEWLTLNRQVGLF